MHRKASTASETRPAWATETFPSLSSQQLLCRSPLNSLFRRVPAMTDGMERKRMNFRRSQHFRGLTRLAVSGIGCGGGESSQGVAPAAVQGPLLLYCRQRLFLLQASRFTFRHSGACSAAVSLTVLDCGSKCRH